MILRHAAFLFGQSVLVSDAKMMPDEGLSRSSGCVECENLSCRGPNKD